MKETLLDAIVSAGENGISQVDVMNGKVGGNSALTAINALAQMRRSGEIVLRREIRGGIPVRIYYSAENAPSVVDFSGGDQ